MTGAVLTTVKEEASRAERIATGTLTTYLRLLALVFLGLSILIWGLLLGIWPIGPGRFDLMSTHWRVYASVLAILAPICAVGLWTTLSWGRVIWFTTIAFQTIAISQVNAGFDLNAPVVFFHAVTLIIYLILQLLLWVIAKKG